MHDTADLTGTTSYTTGPGSIKRFNMFNSAVIQGQAADGYSSGQAMEIMEQIAREHLPDNIGVEWSGLSFQEKQAGGQTGLVLTLVFMFVFLFLAALYESWMVPVAVLLSLPVAALALTSAYGDADWKMMFTSKSDW